MTVLELAPIISPPNSRFAAVKALIIKLTHRCNVRCAYCYEHISKGADMDLATLEELTENVLASTREEHVKFIFHGGEPTLLPQVFFERAVKYAREIASLHSKRVSFGIQTNLVSVDSDRLQSFRDLGIGISVSLDGPAELAGALRPKANAATRNFLKAKDLGIDCGVLMTINPGNWNQFPVIMPWLREVLGVREFKANVVTAVGDGQKMVDLTPVQVFAAQMAILDYMADTSAALVEENLSIELMRMARPLDDRRANDSLCRSRACGAGRAVIGITPDGALLPCGRFSWDDTAYYLGSLTDSSKETSGHFERAVALFHSAAPQTWFDCADCSARHICSYGCQAFISRSVTNANVECTPTKLRYQYLRDNWSRFEPLTRLLHMSKERKRHDHVTASGYSDEVKYSDEKYSDYTDYRDYSDDYTDKGPGKS